MTVSGPEFKAMTKSRQVSDSPFFPLLWRSAGFLLVFSVLQLTWQSLRGTAVEYFIVHTCTVLPAAFGIALLTPGVHVQAIKFTLHAPGGGLNILNGCEGLEALFLLFAAFVVAPIPWRSRPLGLLVGTAVVFIVNQIRILVLFYAYRSNHGLFDSLHGIVAPIIVILIVSVYFYAWLVHSTPQRVAESA